MFIALYNFRAPFTVAVVNINRNETKFLNHFLNKIVTKSVTIAFHRTELMHYVSSLKTGQRKTGRKQDKTYTGQDSFRKTRIEADAGHDVRRT